MGDLHTADYALDNTAQKMAQVESHSTWLTEKREVRLRLRYFEHQLGILRASHVGSVSDLERALKAEEPLIQRGFSYSINEPRQWVQHGSVHLDYREYFRENTYLELQYGYQLNHRREYENSRGNRNSIPAFNLLFQDHQVQLAYHFGGIALGAQSQFGVQSNLPDRRFEAVIPNFNRWLYGAFVEGEHRISERGILSWDAKLNTQRYIAQFYEADNLQSRPFNFVQSSAHLEYTRASATWLQWDILQRMGLRWQERAPYFHELTIDGVHHGTASYELGNADLNKEQLMGAHYELLMKQSAHQFRLGLFGHYIRNFIYQSAGNPVLTIRGAFPLFQYEQVDAAFVGGQLQYRWLWNRYWSLQSQVRYQFAEPLNERSALPLIPPLEFSQSIQFAKWPSSIGEWSLSLQHQYVAQQWHYDPEVELASPPKGYSLWNAEVQWTPRNTKQWNVSLNLLNLTNTAYRNYLDQFRYFADAPGFNAQIFVQYEF